MRSFHEFVCRSSAFISVAFLVGCTGFGTHQTISLDQNSGKGVIVVSALQTFAKDDDPGYLNVSVDSANLYIKSKDGNYKETIEIFNQLLWLSQSRLPIPDTARGDLRVLELPAGEYEIFNWNMRQGTYWSISPREQFSIPFKVVSGESSYLGELALEVYRDSTLGIGRTTAVRLVISDKRERDLAHLSKVHPELPVEKIDIQILRAQ